MLELTLLCGKQKYITPFVITAFVLCTLFKCTKTKKYAMKTWMVIIAFWQNIMCIKGTTQTHEYIKTVWNNKLMGHNLQISESKNKEFPVFFDYSMCVCAASHCFVVICQTKYQQPAFRYMNNQRLNSIDMLRYA